MRHLWLVTCVLVPLTTAFVTYTFVSSQSSPLTLDSTQAAIVCLALIKLMLLGATGIFPIDLDDLFRRVWKPFTDHDRYKRDLEAAERSFRAPPVSSMPCLRRLLCEVETAARTSDQYNQQPLDGVNGRDSMDEVAPERTDPLSDVYIEAVRALYGHTAADSPDCTDNTDKAYRLLHSINGRNCEEAYRLCSGRPSASIVFQSILSEVGLRLKDTSPPANREGACDTRARDDLL